MAGGSGEGRDTRTGFGSTINRAVSGAVRPEGQVALADTPLRLLVVAGTRLEADEARRFRTAALAAIEAKSVRPGDVQRHPALRELADQLEGPFRYFPAASLRAPHVE